jgi:hypothetical protein
MMVVGLSVVCAALGAAVGAFAQDAGGQAAARSPEEIQAARLARTGGLVTKREPGAAVVIIDARPAKGAGDLDALKREMESFCMVAFEVRRQPLGRRDTPLKVAQAALAGKGAAGAVVVLSEEGADAPGMTVFPEDRMALVNATRISGKGVTPEVAARRVTTQLWRAVCFAAGGVNTRSPHCALSATVLAPDDLDTLSAFMPCPEACAQVEASAAKLGLAKVKTATYRTACLQGWAPAPTNDFQRAIWDEVKSQK